jgi:hypothetical protein
MANFREKPGSVPTLDLSQLDSRFSAAFVEHCRKPKGLKNEPACFIADNRDDICVSQCLGSTAYFCG